jgi:hypothetical protein
MIPYWLHVFAIAALAAGFVVALAIIVDEIRRPQSLWIMNIVWPVCALFGTVLVGAAYVVYGRQVHPGATNRRFRSAVGKGIAHCGSGCTLGDILAEWLAFFIPAIAVGFGWQSLFGERTFAVWIFDFILAFGFGILFQYYSIAPMRKLSPSAGIVAALKADTLSLTAWQIGMYAFMAFAQFYLFRRLIGAQLNVDSPEFWFVMQLAMLCGFITSYPVNWWLIQRESRLRCNPPCHSATAQIAGPGIQKLLCRRKSVRFVSPRTAKRRPFIRTG